MPVQENSGSDAPRKSGCPRLARLERARLEDPRSASLTIPEWELLAAFGLDSVAALARRMDELTLLAAYDGAPETLTEFHVERILPDANPSAPECKATRTAGKAQTWGTIRIDYEPETRRVRLSYTEAQLDAAAAKPKPLFPDATKLYAVTLDVSSGAVVLRERRDS